MVRRSGGYNFLAMYRCQYVEKNYSTAETPTHMSEIDGYIIFKLFGIIWMNFQRDSNFSASRTRFLLRFRQCCLSPER